MSYNKDENVQRFALSAIIGELLEREREREKEGESLERERERDSFRILYTGYPLSIVKIKREIDRERER